MEKENNKISNGVNIKKQISNPVRNKFLSGANGVNIAPNNKKPPEFFKPLLWSYNFDSLDLDANKKTIILAAINYGNLEHWRWVKEYYGQPAVAKILATVPATELKRRAGKLAEILFKVKLNYAPRSAY